ncbi:MAG: AAA family ATPase, partial [Eggerthellaceae bacterium]|nr:AAA family ATPase [Eggerthellaceae bacterium]
MRIASVIIENFKGVRRGHVELTRPVGGRGDVTAVCGEDGSGKSALAEALHAFESLFGESGVPNWVASCIPAGGRARIAVGLERDAPAGGQAVRVEYEAELEAKRELEEDAGYVGALYGVDGMRAYTPGFSVRVVSETLSLDDGNGPRTLFTTVGTPLVAPTEICEAVAAGGDRGMRGVLARCGDADDRVRTFRASAYESSRSMLGEGLLGRHSPGGEPLSGSAEAALLRAVVTEVAAFARYGLYVATPAEAECAESGRVVLHYGRRVPGPAERDAVSDLEFDLFVLGAATDQGLPHVSTDPSFPSYTPATLVEDVERSVERANGLLAELGLGRKLALKAGMGPGEFVDGEWLAKGRGIARWQWARLGQPCDAYELVPTSLLSVCGGEALPLACESRGFQKLASIAWLLAEALDEPGFIAVVDDLEAGLPDGLFEKLLNLAAECKGQLILTSGSRLAADALGSGRVIA